ncbi:hypothetical protein Kpho01_31100 [Kitasatospora phosalacinea]|uniref:Transposase n=1 Tax=Kitasatospora phosalacinea TaxID=2065 RepID=A0A9W6PHL9_9ACTN|nr:hypothetical protein Kpho01_31100 [Kitasatospora phosalacinea]
MDTRTDFHQAAVIDSIGRHRATESFPTDPDGYRRLLDWLRSHGDLTAVGVEGTGPAEAREKPRGLPTGELIRQPARSRPGTDTHAPAGATRIVPRRLARRHQYLTEETADADAELRPPVPRRRPNRSRCPESAPRPRPSS